MPQFLQQLCDSASKWRGKSLSPVPSHRHNKDNKVHQWCSTKMICKQPRVHHLSPRHLNDTKNFAIDKPGKRWLQVDHSRSRHLKWVATFEVHLPTITTWLHQMAWCLQSNLLQVHIRKFNFFLCPWILCHVNQDIQHCRCGTCCGFQTIMPARWWRASLTNSHKIISNINHNNILFLE